tara:strand:+ start:457 stop:627 length:171 start_codon:yes stop_codon:yes gene_type:complete
MEKQYKIDKKNIIELKDGRKICSCGFGYHYWLIDQKGLTYPIERSFFNSLKDLRKK